MSTSAIHAMSKNTDSSSKRDLTVLSPGERTAPFGVSVIVCCHNSASRLPATLTHLAGQRYEGRFAWEVILVDNASSDGTARFARELWPHDAPASLRVVHEARLGLAYARRRGVSEANYEFLSFVDDDNWVCPNWVQLVWDLMMQHPEVGACGGFCVAKCELPPPAWFKSFSEMYAVGPREPKPGDVTRTRALWGAGLTLRKSALSELEQNGFRPWLVGRKATTLAGGDDAEMCYALRLAGWRLWYEPRLRLRHFLPAKRLEWCYVRRLARGSGFSTPAHDAYFCAMKPKRSGLSRVLRKIRETWSWQLLSILAKLSSQSLILVCSLRSPMEGKADVLRLEQQIGRLLGLLQMRGQYSERIREIRSLFQQPRWSRRNGQPGSVELLFVQEGSQHHG